MNESQIGVRYSKALFAAALEDNITDKVMDDLKYISEIFKDKDMTYFMESPVIKPSIKKKTIIKIFKDRVDNLTLNFLTLILQNKRENNLNRIIYNFQKMYKAYRGLKSAEIIVTENIGEETKVKFREFLKTVFNSEIEINEKIQEDIIGGFILQVEDLQIDASIKTSLRKIKESLLV